MQVLAIHPVCGATKLSRNTLCSSPKPHPFWSYCPECGQWAWFEFVEMIADDQEIADIWTVLHRMRA